MTSEETNENSFTFFLHDYFNRKMSLVCFIFRSVFLRHGIKLVVFQIQIMNLDPVLNLTLVNHEFYGVSPIFSAYHYLMVKKEFLVQHRPDVVSGRARVPRLGGVRGVHTNFLER
jgi:hypothetical protein